MQENCSAIRTEIKNRLPHVEKKDVVQAILKKVIPTSLEAQKRAEVARKDAHRLDADIKREISNEIRNKLMQ